MRKRYYTKHKEEIKLKKALKKEQAAAYLRQWRANNLEKIRHLRKTWRANNLERFRLSQRYQASKRRAAKLKATPKWVNELELFKIYANCPKTHEVDHICPLRGKEVCGLHVPWNLQYLTPVENQKKGNKCL